MTALQTWDSQGSVKRPYNLRLSGWDSRPVPAHLATFVHNVDAFLILPQRSASFSILQPNLGVAQGPRVIREGNRFDMGMPLSHFPINANIRVISQSGVLMFEKTSLCTCGHSVRRSGTCVHNKQINN